MSHFLAELAAKAPKRAASLDDLSNIEHPRVDGIESMQRAEELSRSEAELECLEECLEQSGHQNRELIIGYYIGEKGQKIRNRKRLAAELDIAPATLRLRAFRLRAKLEGCVKTASKHWRRNKITPTPIELVRQS